MILAPHVELQARIRARLGAIEQAGRQMAAKSWG